MVLTAVGYQRITAPLLWEERGEGEKRNVLIRVLENVHLCIGLYSWDVITVSGQIR